ncbi:hypothetical protein [Microbacterium sp. A1-JK]|uniref:hypothetical protein n=1 Tax=Microbacterium sp. A1-JK TaxID=3177516 RepID=UPI0038844596
MADARLPERYLIDRRVLRLADSERSSLFMATVWSVSNRTDGRIDRADLSLIPTFAAAAIPALVSAELWIEDGSDAWVIADYQRDQTSRHDFEVLEAARRREREKKQRQRARPEGQSQGSVPGDDTGKDRQGKDRQETGQEHDERVDQRTGEVSWPSRVPGQPESWVENDAGEFVPMGRGAA